MARPSSAILGAPDGAPNKEELRILKAELEQLKKDIADEDATHERNSKTLDAAFGKLVARIAKLEDK